MSDPHEDWATAPKDGSVVNVQFPAGTQARVRWSSKGSGRWEAYSKKSRKWIGMEYQHGRNDPSRWWR
jgi:hypothetical protein